VTQYNAESERLRPFTHPLSPMVQRWHRPQARSIRIASAPRSASQPAPRFASRGRAAGGALRAYT
jgi:hypothetical protein